MEHKNTNKDGTQTMEPEMARGRKMKKTATICENKLPTKGISKCKLENDIMIDS
jgi:hypothetical protein